MNTQEIKKLISEKSELCILKELIDGECKKTSKQAIAFKEETGLQFEFVDCERENERYWWVFKLDDKFYQVVGDYDSWAGTEMDDIGSFFEVEKVEKKIYIWEEKKG